MKSNTLTEKYATFLHDETFSSQIESSLHNVLTLIKQVSEVESVAFYNYNVWRDTFELFDVASDKSINLIEQLEDHAYLNKNEGHAFKKMPANLFLKDDSYTQVYVSNMEHNERITGQLLFFTQPNQSLNQSEAISFVEKLKSTIIGLTKSHDMLTQSKKYELMFNVTQKFHSTMQTSEVLSEVIKTIKSVYPHYECSLFLSKTHQHDTDLPIKELIYNDEYADKASVQAFLSGEIKQIQKPHKRTVYAPLNGKQGIYGVMQLMIPSANVLLPQDIEFIRLLANTAGNALENAQLYQQSNHLVSDLQLINTFVHGLNKLETKEEITSFIKQQFLNCVSAKEIGFLLLNKTDQFVFDKASSKSFMHDNSESYIAPILNLVKDKQAPVFIGDRLEKDILHTMTDRSVILLPMVQMDQLLGVVVVTHKDPYHFTFEQFKLLRSLIEHATLAFYNMILREKLERTVITDYLTKLYSRQYLDEKCAYHLKNDREGVFVLFDLDDFKQINDQYGHDVGDTILVQVANILRKKTEKIGFVARWGGEELVVYLVNASIARGKQIVRDILRTIENETTPKITASVGITHWKESYVSSLSDLFDQADQALYKAKRNGKNQLQLAKPPQHS
ncbi:diguanylate cyclase (GGDEF) domain-containing protein [Pelagirhabdus alkalitolerans]|uniref:Diguanylate cyclase (GGDEF) domain-containing protein n=1 Tax=Pelagirhabdus alkalitolerans TaxID=1612202 RepID=A0A1G6HJ26_9BACI|nr:diguanylate cyclase [Pelagirhabdus alkalitolerans]SDB94252.1 diguanylate cyclase (GGDEF) domain-containing protein [Pelagirhabdus alkalitolerans]